MESFFNFGKSGKKGEKKRKKRSNSPDNIRSASISPGEKREEKCAELGGERKKKSSPQWY